MNTEIKNGCAKLTDDVLISIHTAAITIDTADSILGHIQGCCNCRQRLELLEGRLRIISVDATGSIKETCPTYTSSDFLLSIQKHLPEVKSKLIGFHLGYCRLCQDFYSQIQEYAKTNCDGWSDELLILYQKGSLSARLLPLLEIHIENCMSCNNRLGRLDDQKAQSASIEAARVVPIAKAVVPNKEYRWRDYILLAAMLFFALCLVSIVYSYFDQQVVINQPVVNRYQNIELHLNRAIYAKIQNALTNVNEALQISELMSQQLFNDTGDTYGLDHTALYRQLLNENHNFVAILDHRKRLDFIINYSGGDRYEGHTRELESMRPLFLSYGIKTDLERIDIQVAKLLVKQGKYQPAQIVLERGTKQALEDKHNYSYLQFLYWQGENYGRQSNFDKAVECFNQVINQSSILDLDLQMGAQLQITSVYYVNDLNIEARDKAEHYLQSQNLQKPLYVVQFLQIAGMTSLQLKEPAKAEAYLRRAIQVAEEHNIVYSIANSQSFLGIIYAEQGKHQEALQCFNKAFQVTETIKEQSSRESLETFVYGYYARSRALAGKPEQAIVLYDTALDLAKASNVQQKLVLSQLHQGLGESLLATKGNEFKAKQELDIAIVYDKEAKQQMHINNDSMTFAVSHLSVYDIRKQLP